MTRELSQFLDEERADRPTPEELSRALTALTIELEDEKIDLHADNDYRMTALVEVLQAKFVKRGLDLKSFCV